MPAAPTRRSIIPSTRQYAGSITGLGAPPRPAAIGPAANHSVFVTVSATPGSCSFISAAHAGGVGAAGVCAAAAPAIANSEPNIEASTIERMAFDLCLLTYALVATQPAPRRVDVVERARADHLHAADLT